jgi:hypothetical protein
MQFEQHFGMNVIIAVGLNLAMSVFVFQLVKIKNLKKMMTAIHGSWMGQNQGLQF